MQAEGDQRQVSASRRFKGIGRCIYCPEPAVGEEHIIARAFGGLLVMDCASCRECERLTSALETKCASNMFGPAKSYFGIKGRKSKAVPTLVQTYLGDVPARRKTPVPAAEHPNVIWMAGFVGPGLFLGRDPAAKVGVQLMPIPLAPGWLERLTAIGGAYVTPGIDPGMYGRVLAKIAHAYAMATKAGEFTPCLIEHIRGESPLPLSHYMGRRVEPVGVSKDLHEIDIHPETLADGRSFWFVRLRLFASTPGTPIHDIIVGEAID